MKKLMIAILAGALLLATVGAALAGPDAQAVKMADAWLALIDQGKYAEAWDKDGSFFQQKVNRVQWDQIMKALLAKTGSPQGRKLIWSRAIKDLPDAPKGHYLVLFYAPNFQKAPLAIEVVVLSKTQVGWQVLGYRLK